MNTKKFISDTLLELINEKHFDKITIRDILERAQISRSTFYSYFENKYDVINWYCNEQARKILAQTENQNWYQHALLLNKFAEKNKSFFKCMYQKDSTQSYFLYAETYMYDFLKKAYMSKHNCNTISTQQHIKILYAVKGNMTMLQEWITKDLPLNYKDISDLIYNLLPEEIRECL